jgi:UDP-N-acetylglucosamine acyltransferase
MDSVVQFWPMSIHPTAIIGKNVTVGSGNEIGPHVVIEDGVRVGSGNKLLAGSFFCSGTQIGDRNEFHMGSIIGNSPQDRAFQNAPSFTRIGNNNIIREYVTIHRGTRKERPRSLETTTS